MNLPMKNEDIVREYAQAKDKNKQVEILADMNLCSRQEILDILQRHGAVSGSKKRTKSAQKKAPKKKVVWSGELTRELLRLSEQNTPKEEIAQRLGVDLLAVKNKLQRMKREQPEPLASQTVQQTTAPSNRLSDRLARAALYADFLSAADPDRLRDAQSMGKMAAEVSDLLWQIYDEFTQKKDPARSGNSQRREQVQ